LWVGSPLKRIVGHTSELIPELEALNEAEGVAEGVDVGVSVGVGGAVGVAGLGQRGAQSCMYEAQPTGIFQSPNMVTVWLLRKRSNLCVKDK